MSENREYYSGPRGAAEGNATARAAPSRSGNTSRVWSETLVTNGLNAACGLLTGVLVARLLLPEGRGALALVTYWPQLLAGVGLLSVPAAIVYRRARIRDEEAASLVSTAFWLVLGLAAMLALLGLPILPRLVDDKQLADLSQLYLIVWLPVHFVGLTLLAVDHGRQAFRRYNALRLVPQWSYLCLLLVLWAAGHATVSTVVFASWAGVVLTALVRVALAHRELRVLPRLRHVRPLVRTALGFHGASLLGILALQVDRMVVVSAFDHALIGHYMVALTFASVGLNVVQGAFTTLLFPKMAARSGDAGHRALLVQTLRYASFLLFSSGLVLVICAPWVIPALFGSAFQTAVPLAQVLVVACVVQALRQTVVVGCRGMHLFAPPVVSEAATVAGTLLVVFFMLEPVGGLSVPLALLVGNFLGFGYFLLFLSARLEIGFRDWWGLTPGTALAVLRRVRSVASAAFGV